VAFVEQHRCVERQVWIVRQDRPARGGLARPDHPPVAAGAVFAPLQVRCNHRVVADAIEIALCELERRVGEHRRERGIIIGLGDGIAEEAGDRDAVVGRRDAVRVFQEQGGAIEATGGTCRLIGAKL
jgi:hypothetical protein